MIKAALVGMAVLGSSFLLTGCLFGCDPGNNSQRAPVTFEPSSTDATRSCNSYELQLLGDTSGAAPYTLIKIDIAANAVVGQETPLWLDSTTAQSSDHAIAFSIQASSNLDSSPLASVVVTPDALPTVDGDLVKVELQLTFEDGRVLDQVYAAPMTTQGQCGI